MSTPLRLLLTDSLHTCPKIWQRFIHEYNPEGDTSDHMHEVLAELYHGKMFEDLTQNLHYVDFEDESFFVLFKLRWE